MSSKRKRNPKGPPVEVQRAAPIVRVQRNVNRLKIGVKIALAEAEVERRFGKANETPAPKD